MLKVMHQRVGRRGGYVSIRTKTDRRDYINPGQEHYPVFDTPWGKAGFLICTFRAQNNG